MKFGSRAWHPNKTAAKETSLLTQYTSTLGVNEHMFSLDHVIKKKDDVMSSLFSEYFISTLKAQYLFINFVPDFEFHLLKLYNRPMPLSFR